MLQYISLIWQWEGYTMSTLGGSVRYALLQKKISRVLMSCGCYEGEKQLEATLVQ